MGNQKSVSEIATKQVFGGVRIVCVCVKVWYFKGKINNFKILKRIFHNEKFKNINKI